MDDVGRKRRNRRRRMSEGIEPADARRGVERGMWIG
uniref:Uncharacterized protein n=1 Tax=Arundo donax TaxID=35708 RepID=A0A0A9CD65_ARUDO